MEACMVKPEVKKKPVKPKPPPKPAQLSQLKRNEQERLEQPVSPRPPGPPKPPPKPPQLKTNEPERLEQPAPPKPDAETGELSSGKIFTEVVKTAEAASIEENVASLISDESCNSDHWENSNMSLDFREKGGFFSVFLPKSNKLLRGGKQKQDVEHLQTQTSDSDNVSENDDINSTDSLHSELSDSLPDDKLYDDELSTRGELLNESQTKERGGIFSGIFRKSPRQTETTESAETKSMDTELLIGNNLTERKQKKSSGLFGKILKKTTKLSRQQTESLDSEEDETESSVMSTDELSESSSTRVKKRGLAAIFQRSASTEDVFEESKSSTDKKISSSWDNLLKATVLKEKKTAPPGILKKSPQPAPHSNEAEDLRSNKEDLPCSWDGPENSSEEKRVRFIGMFKKTPKTREPQNSDDMEELGGGELGCRRTIKRKKRVVSFKIRQTPSQIPKITSSSQTSDKTPIIEDNDEMQQSNPAEEGSIEVQSMEMAAYPTGDHPTEYEQEGDELMEWWNTAKGWTEWTEMSNIQEQDQEMAVEQAADRVYLAARVFVRLFNQRGGSLQRRILELLSLADAADHFHRKTVSAAVGGGVASVAGSVATITGLILAPFTFGASVIVTAVGISVATAGGITSATANITDTVHSRMDRKKVEKMIQGYQEEISDIRECLEFVQEGMDTLQEWDFERYSQSAAKKALNHSIKHVVKEGGRAGKELMINTTTLISTVQLLGATGGAIKAAQVVSVTTGVMSALFLALDVFFLAKDSHELRKGAKTQFAAKIREVCKELQQGLLELNKVKTQLQKTMDGIEVEEYEEVQEVEVEIEHDLDLDPKKLHELEQELDLLEVKLDKKVEEKQKKTKKETGKEKRKETKEKSKKEKEVSEIKEVESKKKHNKDNRKNEKNKDEVEGKLTPESHILPEETEKSVKAAKDGFKEQSQEGSKKGKRAKNQRKKCESKLDKAMKHRENNKKTAEEKTVDVKETRSRSDDSIKQERVNIDRETGQRKRQERVIMPEWKPLNQHMESVGSETHSNSSKSEGRGSDKEKENDSSNMERAPRRERNRRETQKGRELTEAEEGSESKTEGRMKSDLRKESHRSQTRASTEEVLERGQRSSMKEPDSFQTMAVTRDQREEDQGRRVEDTRRQCEREGGEKVNRRKRREDRKGLRRDGESADRHRGPGPRPSAQLADGLYI